MKTKFLIPLIAGVALFCACKGKRSSGYEVVNNSSADSVKVDTAESAQPKLIKKGTMRIKVKNIEQTSTYITNLTNTYHGMVMQHNMEATEERSVDRRLSNDSVMRITVLNKNAGITVKIPSENIEEFMDKIAAAGVYVNNRKVEISDESLYYLSTKMKLKGRSELVAQQKRGKVVIKDPSKVLNLKDEMVDQLITGKTIDDEARNTTIALNLYQSNTINREVIVNDDPAAYDLPVLQRLSMAVQNGWMIFIDVFIGLANLWVFIALGISGWFLIKYYKTRKTAVVVKA